MAADLAGRNMGRGEIARRIEALVQFVIRRQIDIDLLVAGTAKRARRCRGKAAGGAHLPGEELQARLFIIAAAGRKNGVPDIFRFRQNRRDNGFCFIVTHRCGGLSGRSGLFNRHGLAAAVSRQTAEKLYRVDAENEPGDTADHQQRQNAFSGPRAPLPPDPRRSSIFQLWRRPFQRRANPWFGLGAV